MTCLYSSVAVFAQMHAKMSGFAEEERGGILKVCDRENDDWQGTRFPGHQSKKKWWPDPVPGKRRLYCSNCLNFWFLTSTIIVDILPRPKTGRVENGTLGYLYHQKQYPMPPPKFRDIPLAKNSISNSNIKSKRSSVREIRAGGC